MTPPRAWRLAAVMLVAGLWPSRAHAQDAPTQAELLFRQGRAALEAKDYATACATLAQSEKLDPAVGTLISLAECEEASGKLAVARLRWQEAAELADRLQDTHGRAAFARSKQGALDRRVPRLTIQLAPGAPAGTTVQCDDGAPEVSLGVQVPLDLGAHTLNVEAPQHEARRYRVTLGEGDNTTLDVEPGPSTRLPTDAAAPGVAQEGPASTRPPQLRPAPAPPPVRPTRASRILAVSAASVGLVGLGIGSAFGIETLSKWSEAKRDCGAGCPDGSTARALGSTAHSSATVSTIGFVAGGVGLAVGAIAYFYPVSKAAPTSASLGVVIPSGGGPPGLSLRGAF